MSSRASWLLPVLIEAADRPGLERLLRYCARPAFASERLSWDGSDPPELDAGFTPGFDQSPWWDSTAAASEPSFHFDQTLN